MFSSILDLVFPKFCVGCKKEGEWICSDCLDTIKFLENQNCPSCHRPNIFGEFCSDCESSYSLDGALVAADYQEEIIEEIIKKMKYSFVSDLGKNIGDLLAVFFMEFKETIKGLKNNHFDFDNCLVMPVPLHPKRLRWRGFNQAEIIANKFVLPFDLKKDYLALGRKKYARPQARLKKKERTRNILNNFFYQGDYLSGRDILLVDDVITSGATLNECAKVLKDNGAGRVWGLAFARNM